MNYLGHSWVALKSTNRHDSLLIAGSHIPDLVPFVSNSVFTFKQIHESGDMLLNYLKINHPDKTSLALGIISHGVKFGADGFNHSIESLLNLNKKTAIEFAKQISEASEINFKTARENRMHNFLWTGIEMYLSKNVRFIEELEDLNRGVNYQEVTKILAEFFHHDERKIGIEVTYFLNRTAVVAKNSHELVTQWQDIARGLPEGDQIDVEKTAALIEEIYDKFANQWEAILGQITSTVTKNMDQFV